MSRDEMIRSIPSKPAAMHQKLAPFPTCANTCICLQPEFRFTQISPFWLSHMLGDINFLKLYVLHVLHILVEISEDAYLSQTPQTIWV